MMKVEKINIMGTSNRFERRMYFFVPYNISPIQQGIQAGHCALEYANKYYSSKEFQDFMKNDKTWIILNGGTTRDFENGVDNGGDLNILATKLAFSDIPFASFREPDLNHALTAICFIADERVWKTDVYVDYEEFLVMFGLDSSESNYETWLGFIGGMQNLFLRNIIKDKKLA